MGPPGAGQRRTFLNGIVFDVGIMFFFFPGSGNQLWARTLTGRDAQFVYQKLSSFQSAFFLEVQEKMIPVPQFGIGAPAQRVSAWACSSVLQLEFPGETLQTAEVYPFFKLFKTTAGARKVAAPPLQIDHPFRSTPGIDRHSPFRVVCL